MYKQLFTISLQIFLWDKIISQSRRPAYIKVLEFEIWYGEENYCI